MPDGWFEHAFGADYLRRYRHRDEEQAAMEVAFAVAALRLTPGALVLDLGCGAGRHLGPLLQSGMAVTGVDLSRDLLAHARAGLGRAAGPPQARLVRVDMRALPFGAKFDAVLSFFTSFGYFFDEAENHRVVCEIGRVLRPKGKFLLDLMDRDWVTRELVPHSVRDEQGVRLEERRWITRDGLRVEKEAIFGEGPTARRFHESVRMYTLAEVRDFLASQGLGVERVVGDFNGLDYVPGRRSRMIIVGSRQRGDA